MFLKRLRIHNYKSLRNVHFSPTPLSALIGPNASGKSNFANAIHFLSEVYNHGLELAIARKGGFENIAFRKHRRTKAPIEFELEIEASSNVLGRLAVRKRDLSPTTGTFRLIHLFTVDTPDTGIRAEFSVKSESYSVHFKDARSSDGSFMELIRFSTQHGSKPELTEVNHHPWTDEFKRFWDVTQHGLFWQSAAPQELFINTLPIRSIVRPFTSAVANFAVYQLSPPSLRQAGIPTPNPMLSISGESLPALVDWLQRKYPKLWANVMDGMRDVVPGLTNVQVQYLHTKALGLFFTEETARTPWSADDVSDGTVQNLALLVAAADPRSSLLLVEEPENSLHPWMIRSLVKRFRETSKAKNVLLTTHSPVLVDLLEPEEAWVLSRRNGETSIQRLVDIVPSLADDWRQGKFRLSEYLDAGFVPLAVPGGGI